MTSAAQPRVFLDVNIGAESIGRLVIELFVDKAPRTCENFRAICTGSYPHLSYRLAPFHRIIDEFMVQGGDITKGDGTGGSSIYGGEFEDESLEWRAIDEEGLVCMANRGKATNSSQFFITLAPCEHLNFKHTIFGQLVSGQDALRRMAKVKVDSDDRPLEPVLIAHCGELERRKRAADAHRNRDPKFLKNGRGRSCSGASASQSDSSSGGVRPEKRGYDHSSPLRREQNKRVRRRSDHSIDENKRGRARVRSRQQTRSPSPLLEESRSERQRSREPSRSPRHRSSRSSGFRRRPSLPNHYERRKRRHEFREDEERLMEEEMEREGGPDRYRDAIPNDGRLGGSLYGNSDGAEGEIKFKGRGSMKYREKKR